MKLLGLATPMPATDATIQKKILILKHLDMLDLPPTNKGMECITKIIKALGDSGLIKEGVFETIENKK